MDITSANPTPLMNQCRSLVLSRLRHQLLHTLRAKGHRMRPLLLLLGCKNWRLLEWHNKDQQQHQQMPFLVAVAVSRVVEALGELSRPEGRWEVGSKGSLVNMRRMVPMETMQNSTLRRW